MLNYGLDISFDIHKIETKYHWSISCSINFLSDVRIVLEIFLHKNGDLKEYIHDEVICSKKLIAKNFLTIREICQKELMDFVLSAPYTNIAWHKQTLFQHKSSPLKLKIISFFLKYKNLTDVNFFYWDDNDIDLSIYNEMTLDQAISFVVGSDNKMLKSVFYTTFSYQIESKMLYNPIYDSYLCMHFKNIHYKAKLIAISQDKKKAWCQNLKNSQTFEAFLEFLLSNYSQKEGFDVIMATLKNISNLVIFQDILCMFEAHRSIIKSSFKKEEATLYAIYNIFINSIQTTTRCPHITRFAYSQNSSDKENIYDPLYPACVARR